MRKFLLWAAAVTFSFATFLASCATDMRTTTQAPAAATSQQDADQSDSKSAIPDGADSYSGAFLSR